MWVLIVSGSYAGEEILGFCIFPLFPFPYSLDVNVWELTVRVFAPGRNMILEPCTDTSTGFV